MSNPQKLDTPEWRQYALDLGVDPDEPDDFKYWTERRRAEQLIASFRYHQPNDDQIMHISNVRSACIACAKHILQNTPSSADQTAALRKLHECMMTANKAIVCEGQS